MAKYAPPDEYFESGEFLRGYKIVPRDPNVVFTLTDMDSREYVLRAVYGDEVVDAALEEIRLRDNG